MIKQVFKTMVAFLAVATMTIGPAWGQNSSTSSLVFTEAYGTGGATADDEVEWTVTSDGTESNYDGTKGIHYGTSKLQVQYIQLSTSDIIGTITQVKVNASTASGVNDATVSVTVGGNAFGGNAQGLSINATDYTFTGSATGEIVVRVAKSSAAIRALYVKSVVVTYTPASSGGGSGSETPTPGQNSSTYNVTFGGFSESEMNTTVNVASLPQTFTTIGHDALYPWTVISTAGNIFFGATVTSGGEGKVSVSFPTSDEMTITVTGPFEGTATIHVTGEDDENRNISCDITVSCVSNAPAAPTPHTVRFAEGMSGWQVQDVTASASATAPAVLENVIAGDSLVVTAPATLPGKVKSVKAVKYVAPAATVTTAPTATDAYIEVGSTAALVNAGAANGGTMMYAVTTTNAQPASTADFSATRPTAEGRTAGTYYVWYYAKADADHSDSEIAGPVSVPLATTVTWNSSNISDLEVMGNFQSYTKEGITLSANSEMNGARWQDRGDESRNGISFEANESGGFTFTAPTGKKFTKIEMTPNSPGGWDLASLGTGWAFGEDHVNNIYKVTWKGSAASTVGLLTGANNFGGEAVKSIVFTLIDAQ